jgi:hypothetical protein
MTISRDRRRESGLRWFAVSLLTIIALTQAASSQILGSAFVTTPNTSPSDAPPLLLDFFDQDSELNPNLWTTDSPFLTALANASGSPPPTFVPPTLAFNFRMDMSGPDENNQATGVQSLSTFAAPVHVKTFVAPISGEANAFEIFLANEDLSQFVTVSCNIQSGEIWANAPNVSQISQLGEGFSPSVQAQLGTVYRIEIIVNAKGEAAVKIRNTQKVVLGSVSGLQVGGVGPFYLVLGQKIGSASPTPLGAGWYYVNVTE